MLFLKSLIKVKGHIDNISLWTFLHNTSCRNVQNKSRNNFLGFAGSDGSLDCSSSSSDLTRSSGDDWVQANEEPVSKNQYRVKGLPVGEKMLFRVVAVNIAGRSPPATLGQAVTIREIMGQRHVLSLSSVVGFVDRNSTELLLLKDIVKNSALGPVKSVNFVSGYSFF